MDKKSESSGFGARLTQFLDTIGREVENLAEMSGDELAARIEEAVQGLESVAGLKVVCIRPDLGESVEEVTRAPRDQVVMVRVDEQTSNDLDAWVETGAVKSRSEAAAVFIREGLKVRAEELNELRDALEEVENAKQRLKRRVQEVFKGTEAEAEAES